MSHWVWALELPFAKDSWDQSGKPPAWSQSARNRAHTPASHQLGPLHRAGREVQWRFSFRTRDQAWSLKSFCVAEFYSSLKRDRQSFWHRHQKGDGECPNSLVLSRPHILLEKEIATHSSTFAWRIPWTKEPGRLQSMGSQRVRYDWATNTHSHSLEHTIYVLHLK